MKMRKLKRKTTTRNELICMVKARLFNQMAKAYLKHNSKPKKIIGLLTMSFGGFEPGTVIELTDENYVRPMVEKSYLEFKPLDITPEVIARFYGHAIKIKQ